MSEQLIIKPTLTIGDEEVAMELEQRGGHPQDLAAVGANHLGGGGGVISVFLGYSLVWATSDTLSSVCTVLNLSLFQQKGLTLVPSPCSVQLHG